MENKLNYMNDKISEMESTLEKQKKEINGLDISIMELVNFKKQIIKEIKEEKDVETRKEMINKKSEIHYHETHLRKVKHKLEGNFNRTQNLYNENCRIRKMIKQLYPNITRN